MKVLKVPGPNIEILEFYAHQIYHVYGHNPWLFLGSS